MWNLYINIYLIMWIYYMFTLTNNIIIHINSSFRNFNKVKSIIIYKYYKYKYKLLIKVHRI